jgi:hypothetical protein
VPKVADEVEETAAAGLLPAKLLEVAFDLLTFLLLIERTEIDGDLRRGHAGYLLQAGPGGRFKSICARHFTSDAYHHTKSACLAIVT